MEYIGIFASVNQHKNTIRKLLFAIVIIVLIIGCSTKEEETQDPALTPQELLLGEWNCTSWTQDGAELMDNVEYYKMNYYLESSVETFEYEYMTNTDGQKWQGTYEFQDNNSKLKTNFTNQWFWNGSSWQSATPGEDKVWDIDKLTAANLELSYIVSTQGGIDYVFKMVLQK